MYVCMHSKPASWIFCKHQWPCNTGGKPRSHYTCKIGSEYTECNQCITMYWISSITVCQNSRLSVKVCKLTERLSKLAVVTRSNGKTIFYFYSKQNQLKLPLVHSESTANSCSAVSKLNQNPQSNSL